MQKADLQPADGESPDRVAVDQKAIRLNDEQYWLYVAVDPETNRILHSRHFRRIRAQSHGILAELTAKHDVEEAVFLIDDVADLIGGLSNEGLSYRIRPHGNRIQVERVFREV